jgi:hypothetical protein
MKVPSPFRPFLAVPLVLVVCLAGRDSLFAQAPLRLIDQEPFDQLTVKDGEKRTVLKVQPVDLKPRRVPEAPDPDSKLRVRLFDQPDQPYEVAWKDIETLAFFEQLVLDEAAERIKQKEFDEAYACYRFVEVRDPDFPGLAEAYQRCLFFEAASWHRAGEHDQALALLDELYRREPAYKNLEGALADVVDKLVAARLAAGDHPSARKLVESLSARFPACDTAVRRSAELAQAAAGALDEARAALARGDLRTAYDRGRDAVAWWPAVEGGEGFVTEVRLRYPVVFVAVERTGFEAGGARRHDWASLRRRRLVERLVAEPASAEGAVVRYASGLGVWSVAGSEAAFTVDAAAHWSNGQAVTTFDVAGLSLALADRSSPWHAAAWTAALADVECAGDRVRFTFHHPIVRPETLLALPFRPWYSAVDGAAPAAGPYEAVDERADESRYVLRPGHFAAVAGQPSEVVERRFAPLAAALGPLAAGEVAAADRIPPWELPRFKRVESLKVEPYALPTLHLLVPSPRNRLLADPIARRAVLETIDLPAICTALVGEGEPGTCQPLTGPLPLGVGDSTLEFRDHDPRRLAAAVARDNAAAGADVRPRWVLAIPPTEVARRAGRLVQAQLQRDGRGPAVELLELADPAGADWDLLYVEWPSSDPRVDLERLVGPGGLAPGGAWVTSALAELWRAEDEEDVAARLAECHRAVHAELPVLPLWQVTEHFACQRRLAGVGARPFTLYQNLADWRQGGEGSP